MNLNTITINRFHSNLRLLSVIWASILMFTTNEYAAETEDNTKIDIAQNDILIVFAQSSVPDDDQFVEYSIDKTKLESLPAWEPGDLATNVFTISLDRIIEIARADVMTRYGAHQDKMYLDCVFLRRIENQKVSRWYYSVQFIVNTSSRPFNPSANKEMRSIVLMDGSVVPPQKTARSESFYIRIHQQKPSIQPLLF